MTELKEVIELLNDTKLKNIVSYDLEMQNPFFDYFVIASASNKRQLNAMLGKIYESDLKYDHIEGTDESGWILVDMGNIILNLMTEEMREYYSLDSVYIRYKKTEY